MKSKAFTLIEVMVSVIIISVVGLSLLKIHSNHTNTFEFAIDRIDINEKASIVLNNYSTELEDKDRNLMEIIKSKYPNFRNDELEQILKNEEVHIKKVEIAQIEPFASEDIEEDEDEFIDDGEEGEIPIEPILLNRVDVKFEKAGTFLYSFEFEGMEHGMPTVPIDDKQIENEQIEKKPNDTINSNRDRQEPPKHNNESHNKDNNAKQPQLMPGVM